MNSDYVPSKDNHVTTKKYVDDTVKLTSEICLGRKFIPTTFWNDVGGAGTTGHLYWDKSLVAWHPTDADDLSVLITETELTDNANFEKGNITLYGYKEAEDEWRMIGFGVHDGEVHVKSDTHASYYYVNLTWKRKPEIKASDFAFCRIKMDGYF